MSLLSVNTINKHPAIFMMEQWQVFMQGIDRITGFYHNKQDNGLHGIEWTNSNDSSNLKHFAISRELEEKMEKVAKEKQNFQWLRADLLPFVSTSNISFSQLNLFDEGLYIVLMVKAQGENIHYPDLYYLFFRNDRSNFGISEENTALEPDHKVMIGRMVVNFAKMTISNFLALKEADKNFKDRTRNLLESRQVQYNLVKEQFSDWKNEWLHAYLSEISQRDLVNYVILEKAKRKLLESNISFGQLKESIDNAIVYICELNDIYPGEDVVIDESLLVIKEPEQERKIINTELPLSRMAKTGTLLDRLEKAANDLIQKGISPTSAEVGSTMDKPISAPAITDALRKNKVRILQLFEQYPQHWPVIRQHFKPIINLRERGNSYLSVSG